MRIKFSKINLEAECAWDCINNQGFLINDTPFSDVDKSIRNMDGPRSPRFGTTWNDPGEFADRYRCTCGNYVGAQFEGELCPDCNTPIEYVDIDVLYHGWLNFSPHKLISPLYFQKLQSALSKKVLEGIISNENIITFNGVIRKYSDPIEIKKSMMLYYNIGLKEFYENYEEIMLYYKKKRKPKADLMDQLIAEKDYVWSSKFPVYSTALRPHSVTTESHYFSPIDRQINPLTKISLNLKNASEIEIPLYLYQAQNRINLLWQLNFSLIDGKYGWLRSKTLGGEFNYSARAVIVLDPTLPIDQIDVSYKSFIVLFSGAIIKRLRRRYGWTITKAHNHLKSRFMFDEEIYKIMLEIVHEEKPRMIIQRNPTICYGSILFMGIRDVIRDSNDTTLAIPSAILPPLNEITQSALSINSLNCGKLA